MIAIAVVGLLCGLAVFGRVRVVWVVMEVVHVGRDWVGYGPQQVWNGLVHHMHGRLRGCTGPPVIALPLKYELIISLLSLHGTSNNIFA